MYHLDESFKVVREVAEIFDGEKGFDHFGRCMQDAVEAMRMAKIAKIFLRENEEVHDGKM